MWRFPSRCMQTWQIVLNLLPYHQHSFYLFPIPICFWTSAEHELVSWSPMDNKIQKMKKSVMFVATDTISIFSDVNFDKTLSIPMSLLFKIVALERHFLFLFLVERNQQLQNTVYNTVVNLLIFSSPNKIVNNWGNIFNDHLITTDPCHSVDKFRPHLHGLILLAHIWIYRADSAALQYSCSSLAYNYVTTFSDPTFKTRTNPTTDRERFIRSNAPTTRPPSLEHS